MGYFWQKPDILATVMDGTHPLLIKGYEKGFLNVNQYDDDDDFFMGATDISETELNELFSTFSFMYDREMPKPRRKRRF
ncbi:MAG: hypothetical protein HC817_09100 [Saprospiraceae bacterium]|nr:hypothetical protein [Saprospiraceae bacterium]